jgi:hypothetical protein
VNKNLFVAIFVLPFGVRVSTTAIANGRYLDGAVVPVTYNMSHGYGKGFVEGFT